MDMYSFKINNTRLENLGLACRSISRPILPAKNYTSTIVQDRDGEIIDTSGYRQRTISVAVYFIEKNLEDIRTKTREFAYLLRKECKLSFDDEPDKYYKARLLDEVDLEVLGTTGEATLTFSCYPFAFGKTVIKKLNQGHNRDIDYQGTAPTPARVILRNKGTTPVSNIRIVLIKKGR